MKSPQHRTRDLFKTQTQTANSAPTTLASGQRTRRGQQNRNGQVSHYNPRNGRNADWTHDDQRRKFQHDQRDMFGGESPGAAVIPRPPHETSATDAIKSGATCPVPYQEPEKKIKLRPTDTNVLAAKHAAMLASLEAAAIVTDFPAAAPRSELNSFTRR